MLDKNIVLFDSEDLTESEDLPWVKEYYSSNNNPDEALEILSMAVTEKGIFYLTTSAKGFIFKREREYAFLLEALNVWVTSKVEVSPLIVCRVNKKLCYGLNQSRPKVTWTQDSGGKYVSSQVEPSTTQTWKPKHNPFLPSESPTLPVAAATPVRETKKKPAKDAQEEQEAK